MLEHVIDNRGKTPPIQTHGHELIEVNAIVEGVRSPQYKLVKKYVDGETYRNWFRTGVIDEYDILVPTVGTIGSAAISLEKRGAVAQNIIGLRTKPTINALFLYYKLISPQVKGIVRSLNIGVAQPSVKVPHFLNVELELPVEFSEQEMIANILSSYDSLIENNERRIEILETVIQKIYIEWFLLNIKGDKSQWKKVRLENCLDISRGKSYTGKELEESESSVPLVNLKCINRHGGFRKAGLKSFSGKYKESHMVRKGDIVMAVTDMTQERMIVARSARVSSLDADFGVISMDLVKIEPKENCDRDFLYAYLRWSDFADNVKNYANGANVLHLHPDRISEYEILLPPLELQKKFSSVVKDMFEQIDVLELTCENLRKSRDLLIPQLVTGKLAIKS